MAEKLELTVRGKWIFDGCSNKAEMLEALNHQKEFIKDIPDEAKITHNEDDYIIFEVEAKDKDDFKYYKKKGFVRTYE